MTKYSKGIKTKYNECLDIKALNLPPGCWISCWLRLVILPPSGIKSWIRRWADYTVHARLKDKLQPLRLFFRPSFRITVHGNRQSGVSECFQALIFNLIGVPRLFYCFTHARSHVGFRSPGANRTLYYKNMPYCIKEELLFVSRNVWLCPEI